MDSGLLEEFSIEAYELLSEAEDSLLVLESDSSDENAYNSVFRSFHSLKGAAGMMEISNVQKHMHLTEDLFESYKTNRDELKSNIDFFLEAIDHTKKLLSGSSREFDYNKHSYIQTNTKPLEKLDNSTIKLKEILYLDVLGVEFLESDLFKNLDSNIRINHIQSPIDYFKTKKYLKTDAVIIDQSLFSLTQKNLVDEIVYFCYQKDKPNFFENRNQIPIYNSMCSDAFNSLLLQSKTIFNQYKLIEKAYRLLLYQYSDLDKYLKDKGREVVRLTLKSEVKNITKTRKNIFNE